MLRSALRRGGLAARLAACEGRSTRDILRLCVAERERLRRRRRDPGRDEFFVPTPESLAWLDSVSLPMVLTAAAVALFTKLLMMEHESTDQERRERKIKNSHPDQGKVRMLTREEWDEIQEVRPRTPFESKLARPHARLRTGEPVRLEDVKDWATDVIADAFTRVQESIYDLSIGLSVELPNIEDAEGTLQVLQALIEKGKSRRWDKNILHRSNIC